jgi:ribonuclease HI
MREPLELTIFTDGASKGNPGHAGFGYVILAGGAMVREHGEYIGIATNNIAEYRAFAAALEEAHRIGATKVTVYSDSQLAVCQINGQYRVKNEGLLPLYGTVMNLLAGFEESKVIHVYRESNSRADGLANKAIREHLKSVKG